MHAILFMLYITGCADLKSWSRMEDEQPPQKKLKSAPIVKGNTSIFLFGPKQKRLLANWS